MKGTKWQEWKPHIGEVWRLSLPAILTQITTILMQYIDSAMVGALGAKASAATTLVGRSVGAREPEQAKRYGSICTAMGAVLMGITGVLMMIACPLVFRFLTPDLSVRALAARVLRIELIAEPLFGVSIVAAGALRGAGDTFVPSLLNLLSIWVVRIGLALILVKPLGLTGMWAAMAVELCVRGLLLLWRQRTSKHYAMAPKPEIE